MLGAAKESANGYFRRCICVKQIFDRATFAERMYSVRRPLAIGQATGEAGKLKGVITSTFER